MSESYAPARPHRELLEVLGSIAAFQDSKYAGKGPRWGKAGVWCIARQVVIVEWYQRYLKRFGARVTSMCRRTLNYHLAALKRDRYIQSDTPRHIRDPRTGKLVLRPSRYTFTPLGRLWIKRTQGWVKNPFDHLAVQKIAQSGFKPESYSSTSLSRAVGKAPTARTGKPTKKSAAARRPVAILTNRAVRRPAKAPVRSGPDPRRDRARSAPARRSENPKAKAKAKAKARPGRA